MLNIHISSHILVFSILYPLGEGCGPSFEQIWITTTQACFVPILVEIDPVVLKKKIFKVFDIILKFFDIISPRKRVWPFIWTNLNPLHPRMLCAKFGWHWPSGSWEEDENVKSLQTDRQADRRWTKSDQKSSLELSAQVS